MNQGARADIKITEEPYQPMMLGGSVKAMTLDRNTIRLLRACRAEPISEKCTVPPEGPERLLSWPQRCMLSSFMESMSKEANEIAGSYFHGITLLGLSVSRSVRSHTKDARCCLGLRSGDQMSVTLRSLKEARSKQKAGTYNLSGRYTAHIQGLTPPMCRAYLPVGVQ